VGGYVIAIKSLLANPADRPVPTELRLTTNDHNAPVNMWIHCVQLLPLKRLPHVEMQAIINCSANETVSKKFSVEGGRTLEVCAVSASSVTAESEALPLISPAVSILELFALCRRWFGATLPWLDCPART
jgi:hypothetical protein